MRQQIQNIKILSTELVAALRELSRSQKELWQQIPYLALRADGRSGYSDQFSMAYAQGYWLLRSSQSSGYCTVYVDLETGELVDPFDPAKPAHDIYVIKLAKNPEELDVTTIIRYLNKEAQRPIFSGYKSAEQKAWRESKINDYSLGPGKYSRTTHSEKVRV